MHRTWQRLKNLHGDGKSSGGLDILENWDRVSLIKDIVEKDVQDFELDSHGEMIKFALAKGQYSDRRSFMYGAEDLEDFQQEGFFNEPYCPHCIQEAPEADIEDDIDPVIKPQILEYTEDSYMHGAEIKEVTEVWYQCDEHPEFYMNRKERNHV